MKDYFSINKEMAYQRWIMLKRSRTKGNRNAQKERRKLKYVEEKERKRLEREEGMRKSEDALAA